MESTMERVETKSESTAQWLKGALPFIYLIVALLALRWTVVEPYVVPTGSMEPTLKPGDRLYALKCAYDVRFPFTDLTLFTIQPVKRGDVILFRAPRDPDITYVKRAVAVAGDRIAFRDGKFFLNGEEVPRVEVGHRDVMYDIDDKEDKTLFLENLSGVKHHAILDNGAPHSRYLEEITVPEGYVFAVGDNRDHSHDSRAWGFVPLANLKGKAMFIWFSSHDMHARHTGRTDLLNYFLLGNVRPERIGTLIQ